MATAVLPSNLRKKRQHVHRGFRCRGLLLTVAVSGAEICWLAAGGCRAPHRCVFSQLQASVARVTRRCSTTGDAAGEESWQEAYQLELERNALLREQIQLQGLGDTEAIAEPEACAVNWEQNYRDIVECNRALGAQIRATTSIGFSSDNEDIESRQPATFQVKLSESAGGATESIELQRFFGRSAALYSIHATLPLGLNFTKHTSGSLQGGFVVENVLPGGSAYALGEILEGDVLQALTIVEDRQDMGMKTEDFVSSVVGGFGRLRQTLADATFIATLGDLVEALKSNMLLGPDTKVTLVLERNTSASPVPTRPLEAKPVA